MFGYGGRFNGYPNGISMYHMQSANAAPKKQKWYKPENEKQEKAFKRCKGDLKALLVASKEGVAAKGCYKQLCELIEDDFTYQDCGLKTMGEFLFHCDDIMEVRTDGYQGYYLFLRSSAAGELEDLRKLVQGQQNSKSGYKGFKAKMNNTYWVNADILLDLLKYSGSASTLSGASGSVQNKYHQNNPKGSSYKNRSGGGGRSNGFGGGSRTSRSSGFSAPRFQSNSYRSRETPSVSAGLKNAVLHALGEDNFDNDYDDTDFDEWDWSTPSLNTHKDRELEELSSRFTIGKPLSASTTTTTSTAMTTKSSSTPLVTTARSNTIASSTARPSLGTVTSSKAATTATGTAKPLTRPTLASGRFAQTSSSITTTVKQDAPQQSSVTSKLDQRTVTGEDNLQVTVNNVFSSGTEQPTRRVIRNPFVLEELAKAKASTGSDTTIHAESLSSMSTPTPPASRPVTPPTAKTEVSSSTSVFLSKNLLPASVQRAAPVELKSTTSNVTPAVNCGIVSSTMNPVTSIKKNVRRVVEFRQMKLNENKFKGHLLGVDAYGFAYFNLVEPAIMEFHQKNMDEIQAFYSPAEIQADYKADPEYLKAGLLIIIKQDDGKFLRAKIFSVLKQTRECVCYDLEVHEIYTVPFDNIYDVEDRFARKLPQALMCILEGTEDYLMDVNVSNAFEATPMDPPEVLLKVVNYEDDLFGLPIVKMTHCKSGKDIVDLMKQHGAEFFQNVPPRPKNSLTEHQFTRKAQLENIMYIPS